jgi:hypothetical protein
MPQPIRRFTVLAMTALLGAWALAGASPAMAGTVPLIFRDDFEFGLERWSAVLPPSPSTVVWSDNTSIPQVDFDHCALPVGSYTLQVRAESDLGAATRTISMAIAEVPCERGVCREITFSDPPGGSRAPSRQALQTRQCAAPRSHRDAAPAQTAGR